MNLVALDPAPVFVGFGVLTPAGVGIERLGPPGGDADLGAAVAVDLPRLCGESPLEFRRMDRYGALGYAAAHLALASAERTAAGLPAERGVMIGSSLACWGSNARYHREPVSPALFVRTIANSVNGDISIGRCFGGPCETFVSGWIAGAEALAAAGCTLAEGRARLVLAGGVEAPDATLLAMHGATTRLIEGAAIAVMARADSETGPAALRLRAYRHEHDPSGLWSLGATLEALRPLEIETILVANALPPDLRARLRQEAGGREYVELGPWIGELGAVGAVVATGLAEPLLRGRNAGASAALVVARDPAGGTVLLALSR